MQENTSIITGIIIFRLVLYMPGVILAQEVSSSNHTSYIEESHYIKWYDVYHRLHFIYISVSAQMQGSSSVVTIFPARPIDAGSYTCTGTNQRETDSSTTGVTVSGSTFQNEPVHKKTNYLGSDQAPRS